MLPNAPRKAWGRAGGGYRRTGADLDLTPHPGRPESSCTLPVGHKVTEPSGSGWVRHVGGDRPIAEGLVHPQLHPLRVKREAPRGEVTGSKQRAELVAPCKGGAVGSCSPRRQMTSTPSIITALELPFTSPAYTPGRIC